MSGLISQRLLVTDLGCFHKRSWRCLWSLIGWFQKWNTENLCTIAGNDSTVLARRKPTSDKTAIFHNISPGISDYIWHFNTKTCLIRFREFFDHNTKFYLIAKGVRNSNFLYGKKLREEKMHINLLLSLRLPADFLNTME